MAQGNEWVRVTRLAGPGLFAVCTSDLANLLVCEELFTFAQFYMEGEVVSLAGLLDGS